MNRISTYLPLIEKIFLMGVIIGATLMFLSSDSMVMKASLIGLAITYFLFPFRPLDPREDDELGGFSDLLATVMIPKTLWIGSSVSIFGFLIYLFDISNKGYLQLLLTGGLTIGIGAILLSYFRFSGVKNLNLVRPTLIRAIPILVVDLFILLK